MGTALHLEALCGCPGYPEISQMALKVYGHATKRSCSYQRAQTAEVQLHADIWV